MTLGILACLLCMYRKWNRVGGASRPRPPTPPYVLVVYGGFFNVVTRHTCRPEM
jgi:hypothetical protein